jgi:2-C-methyl-D-erythritol 4-phosphate cytidylyltransferase/2-C-methyl-D-erythritol 2,4-cyclodiphosphate synthase
MEGCFFEGFPTKSYRVNGRKRGEIVNVDLTIICELPKIGPFKPRMRQNLSEIFQTPMKNINIKATTTEGLGAMGRKEGISSHASVMVRLPV